MCSIITTVTSPDAVAVAARRRPFRLTLRGTGTFRPVSPVVYLRVDEGWDECVGLHGFEVEPFLTRLQS